MKVIELHRTVTESNDRDAAVLRNELKEKGVFFVNLMSAAGSGKTTLLSRTIADLKDEFSKRISKRKWMPERSRSLAPDRSRSIPTACAIWMPA